MRYLTVLLILCVPVTGCMKKIELQDGFEVTTTAGSENYSLYKPNNRLLVYPVVVDAVDDEHFIIGLRRVGNPKPRFLEDNDDQPYGYFIYDKRAEELTMGLSYEELLEQSETRDISLRLE